MIRIAIVDDELQEAQSLESFFQKVQQTVREELSVTLFSSGKSFLQAYDDSYDLVCLDIDMEDMDGIETARCVRRQDDDVIIIFVTNMAQMAISGYEVRAWDFIVKPLNFYSFSMKVNIILKMIQSKKSRNLIIPTGDGMQKVSSDELYYAEVNGHYLYYHTSYGVFRQKATLSELEDKLAGLSFKRCNNCYLVNLKHVSCVKKDDLQVGGQWLKISRPRKKKFLQALANYMGGTE